MNILNLPAYNVLEVAEEDHDYRVTMESNQPTCACEHCYGENFIRYGQHPQLFMDTPLHAKRTLITVVRKRFKCKDCGRTFMELLPDIDSKRKATRRLVSFVKKLSLNRTFASISDDVGIDEKTVRNIFRDYVNELEADFQVETPRWLGIDEVHLNKKMRCVITNIEERTVVEMLPTRNKVNVIKALRALPNRDRVKLVAMDMWRPYKDAVGIVFPDALCVIDKFHVLKMASEGLEKARRSMKSELTPKERRKLKGDRYIMLKRPHSLNDRERLLLSGWTLNFPQLGDAYTAKESFYSIWDVKNRTKAEQLYESWANGIPHHIRGYFEPLLRAMSNWHTEIFNYFDHPITNAYTESLNGVIKVMHRMGRGYSFDALRARILFADGSKKPVPRAYEQPSLDKKSANEMPFTVVQGEPLTTYGSDITTLIRLVKDDE